MAEVFGVNLSPPTQPSLADTPGYELGRASRAGAPTRGASGGLRHFGRAALRLGRLAAVILATLVSLLAARLVRSSYRSRALRLQRTSRALLRVMKIRYASFGRPPDGVIIAANHVSYLDILVLSAITPVVFVAKREVRHWPTIGPVAALAGTRFIDRAQPRDVMRVAAELAPVLREGVSVVLFLEGTSTDGREVRPFKSSLLEPAVAHQWPVVPVALGYEVPPQHSAAIDVCWWGDMTLPAHLWKLATLAWVGARVNWGAPLTDFDDRKALARAAHERVTKLHAQVQRVV